MKVPEVGDVVFKTLKVVRVEDGKIYCEGPNQPNLLAVMPIELFDLLPAVPKS